MWCADVAQLMAVAWGAMAAAWPLGESIANHHPREGGENPGAIRATHAARCGTQRGAPCSAGCGRVQAHRAGSLRRGDKTWKGTPPII